MAAYQFNFSENDENSSRRVLMKLDGGTVNVRAVIRHLRKTDKWYLSIYNIVTGDPILTYIPIVSCSPTSYYNILEKYGYKDLGAVAFVPVNQTNAHTDPAGNDLSPWYMIWGD